MLTSFAFGAMVLLSNDHEGFDTLANSVRSLQRLATNEISITSMTENDLTSINLFARLIFHILYLILFKWLLTEAVFLGLILDSWVRVYSTQRRHVLYSLKICKMTCFKNFQMCIRLPCSTIMNIKYVCCNTRLCISKCYDRCCFFENIDHGRKYMSVTEALLRLKTWRKCELNQSVKFINFKLMHSAMQCKLETDHPHPHHEKQMKQLQANIAAIGGKAKLQTKLLVYDEDVVKMLNSVVIPYYPIDIEHQPNLYTHEQRAIEVLASKGIRNNLSSNALHTMKYGLDVVSKYISCFCLGFYSVCFFFNFFHFNVLLYFR